MLDMGKVDEAIGSLDEAMALGLDTNNDPILINLYYLAERAYKYKDLTVSETYGKQYRTLKDEQLRHQSELSRLESKRLFALSFGQARHEKMIAELERQLIVRKIGLVAKWLAGATLVVYLLTVFVRRRRARKIAEA